MIPKENWNIYQNYRAIMSKYFPFEMIAYEYSSHLSVDYTSSCGMRFVSNERVERLLNNRELMDLIKKERIYKLEQQTQRRRQDLGSGLDETDTRYR